MSFNEYPKVMKHPAHKPAVIAKWDPKIKDPKDQVQGSSAKFPEVIVHNLDQEQQYAALGYKPNGISDPEAYRKAMTGNETKPDGSNKEYPKFLYKADDSVESGHKAQLVKDKAEETALGKGWFRTPDLAKAGASSPEQAEQAQAPSAGSPEAGSPAGGKAAGKGKKAAPKAALKTSPAKKKAGKGRAEART